MQPSQRIAAVLTFPFIAWLGTACERTDTPTRPSFPPAALELSSSSTTRWVNHDGFPVPPGTSCDNPGYATIGDAVSAAGPGDRINVCPGTYAEQVTIPAGKDNIQLRSTRRWEAVIKAPTLMVPYNGSFIIVRVGGAQNITLLAFTITGPGPGGCATLHYGVRVDNGGSADILGNHITQIRDEPFSGCQNGVAVQVGRWAEATTGSARVMGNVIDNYQKNGVTVDNSSSHAEIVHNRVFGIGSTAIIAQNGVQVSRGATANIQHNFVSQNIYAPGTVASTGILFFGPGTMLTDHNTLTSNDVGVYMDNNATSPFGPGCGTPGGSNITQNRVRASTFDGAILAGLAPCLVTNVQVAHNKSDNNDGPGIGVYDGSHDNGLDDNKVEDNKDSGILLDDGQNNSVGDNKVRDNGTAGGDVTDGIRINSASSGNTVHDNRLKHNVTHDCHDNSIGTGTKGTANSWINNDGTTSNPPGLCGEDDNDADFETSTMYGWDAAYPWYDTFGIAAAEFDFAAAYATIDTEGLLQLLPQVRLPDARRPAPSPDQ